MVQTNRDDAILVKIITYDEDKKEHWVASYYTVAIDETLKMFITAKKYEIDCYFNEFSDVVDEKYKSFPGYIIQDVCLKLGTEDDMPVIEVII